MINPPVPSPRPIVVMGVSAVGKSTVAAGLAAAMNVPYVDADDLHSQANRDKMAAGIPLTDDDRWPWLAAVGAVLVEHRAGVVVACSALQRVYRDRIRDAAPDAFFVFLHADPAVLRERAAARHGHFMPPALLDSQLATLEPLTVSECGVEIDAAQPPDIVIEQAHAAAVTGC